MKENHLHVRVDSDTNEQLEQLARRLNIPRSAVVRMFISDGLAQYDRRFDAFIERLDSVQQLVEKLYHLTGAAMAVSLLPPDSGTRLTQDAREQFERRVRSSVYWGTAIKEAHASGALSREDNDVSAS